MRGRIWLVAAVVFATQIGVIFWLSKRSSPVPQQVSLSPLIQVSVESSNELLALQDPTLFILPHRENFSGAAWMQISPPTFQPTNWSEPPLPLALSTNQLGSAFAAFMQTNTTLIFARSIASPPAPEILDTVRVEPISIPSTLRIEGDLADRHLLKPIALPAQTNSDLLSSSEVQLFVDSQGNPRSATLVQSSGRTDVDAMAMNFAKDSRFESQKAPTLGAKPQDKVTFGTMIFEWQTLPPASTNAPLATP